MSATPFEFIVHDGPDAGQRLAVPEGRSLIGSGEACALRFAPGLVRERHAELRAGGGRVEVVDLTGSSLMWLDGTPVQKTTVAPGQRLRLGRLTLELAPTQGEDWNEPTRMRLSAPSATPLPAPRGEDGEGDVNEPTAISGRFRSGELIDGRYRVVERLAAGGMGEVFKVEHVELGKTLALKVMLPDLSNDPEFVNRFKLEAMAASRIGHPNIIDITDFGKTATGRFYFVMEFLDGQTLSDLLVKHKALPPARVAELGCQVARALAAAHEQQIIHRDLKPENVMVLQRPGEPERVKVLDFGVARVQVGGASAGKTIAGIVVGTPQYMSPEQSQGLVVDARSDIYSLGLILHELLTGEPTFHGETPHMVMVQQATAPPPPLPEVVPAALRTLIARMLEKKPAARPQQMKEVLQALEALRNEPRASARAGGPRPPPRPPKTDVVSRPSRPQAERPPAGTLTEQAPLASDPELAAVLRPSGARRLLAVFGALVVVLALGVAVFVTGGTPPPPVQPPEAPVNVAEPTPTPTPTPVPTPTPAPSEPTPAAPKELVVRVESSPIGAEVFEDGVMLGNTPLPLKRAPGSVLALSFSLAGYRKTERKVMVSEDVGVVNVTLEKAPASAPPVAKPRPPQPKLDLKPAPF